MIALGDLAQAVEAQLIGSPEVRVSGVRHDSRTVQANELFVAIPGRAVDGAAFANQAVQRGACAILSEQRVAGIEVPQLVVRDARLALPIVAHRTYGDPTRNLRCLGVTGTNGKTTTTWIVDTALTALGISSCLIGTVETRGPGYKETSSFTTPEADDLARFAADMSRRGATHLAMEVSSHALALHRADCVQFEVAAFTNFTRDHLDFHESMEAYFEAKCSLFEKLAPKQAVLRIDDTSIASLAKRLRNAVTVSRSSPQADVFAENAVLAADGIRARVQTPGGAFQLESGLIGSHNLDNLLVAVGCMHGLGIRASDIEKGLRAAQSAPGRLSRVPDPRGVSVVVDYAHTPDALENVLRALRPLTQRRVICVFGCGGDRDPGKRPAMARAAIEGSDLVIVTSDNPRTEDPASIIEMIVPGLGSAQRIEEDALSNAEAGYAIQADRRRAIELAIRSARAGDTVLIAGKGHEDYQIIGTVKSRFDDREEAQRAVLEATGGAR